MQTIREGYECWFGPAKLHNHTSSVDSVLGLRSVLAEVAPPNTESTEGSKRLGDISLHGRYEHHLDRA